MPRYDPTRGRVGGGIRPSVRVRSGETRVVDDDRRRTFDEPERRERGLTECVLRRTGQREYAEDMTAVTAQRHGQERRHAAVLVLAEQTLRVRDPRIEVGGAVGNTGGRRDRVGGTV